MPQTTDQPAQRHELATVVRDRRGSGIQEALGAVSADALMLRTISADITHAADPRHLARRQPPTDPLEPRDPEYIARTLPALRVMADVWFRGSARLGAHPGARPGATRLRRRRPRDLRGELALRRDRLRPSDRLRAARAQARRANLPGRFGRRSTCAKSLVAPAATPTRVTSSSQDGCKTRCASSTRHARCR